MEAASPEPRTVHVLHLPPRAARLWTDALAAAHVRDALVSSAAALKSLDGALDRMASLDWTATAVGKRLQASAQSAREALRRETTAALTRLDQLPVVAVTGVVGKGRAAVQALSGALQRGAERIPAAPAAEAKPASTGSASAA